MAYCSDALKTYLVARGVATEDDLLVDMLPEQPDMLLSLWESGGANNPSLDCPAPITAERVQLLGRGEPGIYAETRRRVWRAYQTLAAMPAGKHVVTDEDGIAVTVSIRAVLFDGPPVVLERDHLDRVLFTANATVWFAMLTEVP